MLTVPGIKTMKTREKRTEVLCKCGGTLFHLDKGQRLYVQTIYGNDQINSKEGACEVCGEKYTIPIQSQ